MVARLHEHCQGCPVVRLAAVCDMALRAKGRTVPTVLVRWAIREANPVGNSYVISLTPPCANDHCGYQGNRVKLSSIPLYHAMKISSVNVDLSALLNVDASFLLDPYAGLGNAWCNGMLLQVGGETMRHIVEQRVPRELIHAWQRVIIDEARSQVNGMGPGECIEGEVVE